MAKINYEKGDLITFKGGVGMLISGSKALLIYGEGGRTGYDMKIGGLPEEFELMSKSSLKGMNFEIKMALDAAKLLVT